MNHKISHLPRGIRGGAYTKHPEKSISTSSSAQDRTRRTIPSRCGGYISYMRHDTTRTVFSTMPRRTRVQLLFTLHSRRDTDGYPTTRLTPHVSYHTRPQEGAQRAAVDRGTLSEHHTSYELRATSYELRNITTRLDANTNETLTLHHAGCH